MVEYAAMCPNINNSVVMCQDVSIILNNKYHLLCCLCAKKYPSLNPKVHRPPFAAMVVAAVLSIALPGRPSLPLIGFNSRYHL